MDEKRTMLDVVTQLLDGDIQAQRAARVLLSSCPADAMEQNKRLREALGKLRREHEVCDDCWYSCPKSGECCQENVSPECNCGADEANAIIDEALGIAEKGAVGSADKTGGA